MTEKGLDLIEFWAFTSVFHAQDPARLGSLMVFSQGMLIAVASGFFLSSESSISGILPGPDLDRCGGGGALAARAGRLALGFRDKGARARGRPLRGRGDRTGTLLGPGGDHAPSAYRNRGLSAMAGQLRETQMLAHRGR